MSTNVIRFPTRRGMPTLDESIDILELLIANQRATFILTVTGSDYDNDVIEGDHLIVDNSLTPRRGDLVACQSADGERYIRKYPNTEEGDISGVVTFTLRRMRAK